MVLCGLGVAEGVIRHYERRLSVDVAHIRSIPDVSKKVGENPAESALFMGSSLVRYGMDLAVIKEQLEIEGVTAPRLLKVNPDASTIGEWYYYLNTYFVKAGNTPHVLVIGFANNHLEDQRALRPERLGAFCCRLADTPEVFSQDVKGFGPRMDFLLSMGFCCCAHRDRVRSRVLDELIPDYRNVTTQINDTLRAHQPVKAAAAAPVTFTRFQRLLDLAGEHNIRVAVVAMPVQQSYDVDQNVLEMTRKADGLFLDCRHIEALSDKSYLDEIHLNPDGARIFSRAFTQRLASWDPITGFEQVKVGSKQAKLQSKVEVPLTVSAILTK